jgi:hypothetical protein
MMRLALVTAVMFVLGACGDRALTTAGADGAAPDGHAPGDAAHGGDAGPLADAAPGDAALTCEAQQITGCPLACETQDGVSWDGTCCTPIRCCCQGPDCGATWTRWQDCLAAHEGCGLGACAATGGFCLYGDAVVPTCPPGYGKDPAGMEAGECGLGACCAPCPDPADPRVSYVSHAPATCAAADFTCAPDATTFDNECGCGCVAAAAPTP